MLQLFALILVWQYLWCRHSSGANVRVSLDPDQRKPDARGENNHSAICSCKQQVRLPWKHGDHTGHAFLVYEYSCMLLPKCCRFKGQRCNQPTIRLTTFSHFHSRLVQYVRELEPSAVRSRRTPQSSRSCALACASQQAIQPRKSSCACARAANRDKKQGKQRRHPNRRQGALAMLSCSAPRSGPCWSCATSQS